MKGQVYPKYKNSGAEWLGEIPEHWGTKRLKYCAPHINEKYDGRLAELPYTGLEHIESWTGRPIPNNNQITSDGQSNRFKPGDVLFGKLRPYLAKVLRPKEDGICTGELLVLRSTTVAQDYLFYYILNRDFISIVDSSTYGAKMPRANWEFIGNLPLLLPPSGEQQSIATFLDRQTNHINTLISKKEQQIELLQEKRAAIISNAVTKGLKPNVKMKNSGIEWIGEVPRHWKIIRLKRLVSIRGRIGFRGYTVADLVGPGEGALTIGGKHINSINELDLSDPNYLSWDKYYESPEIMVNKGDLVFVQRGSLGKVALIKNDIGPATINPSMILLTQIRAIGEFLYWVFTSDGVQTQVNLASSATAVPMISQELLGNFNIAIPPIEEQRAITFLLKNKTKRIDVMIETVNSSIGLLKEYRTALISAAVTGKIDVKNSV